MNATPEDANVLPDLTSGRNEVLRTSSPAPILTPEPEFMTPNPKYTTLDLPTSKKKQRASNRRKTSAKPRTGRGRETLLYEYFDADGVLLYVGITANLPVRQAQHEKDSTFMDFMVTSHADRFPTRAAAEKEEQSRIEAKRPIFNIEHNDQPDRIRRVVDYLIDRDRRDLLIPMVSRA